MRISQWLQRRYSCVDVNSITQTGGKNFDAAKLQFAQPISRAEKVCIQARFGRSRFGMPVVFPAHERRQRHQDRFGAAAGLQAEQSAAIVDEIEFDITPTTIQLEVALALAERRRAPTRDDRQIRGQEVIADAALISEAALEA